MKQQVVCYTITELRDHCSSRAYEKALNWLTEGVYDFPEMLTDDDFLIDPTPEEATLWKKRMLKAGIKPTIIQQIFKHEPLFPIKVTSYDLDRGAHASFEFGEYVYKEGEKRRWIDCNPNAELVFAVLNLHPSVWKYADFRVVQQDSRNYARTGILLIYNSDEHGEFEDLPKYIQQDILKYLPTYTCKWVKNAPEVPFDSTDTNADSEFLDFEFSDRLLSALQRSNDYLTSEEYLIGESESNEYLYDDDGKPVHHLMNKEYVLFSEKEEVQK